MSRTLLRKTVVAGRSAPGTFVLVALAIAMATPLLAQEPGRTHTVKKGDTLWDIAGLYLNDPLLWPGIYRQNTDVVEDPHWIYPGEVIRIDGGPEVAAVPAEDTPMPPPDTTLAVAEPQPDTMVAGPPVDSAMISMEPVPEEYDPGRADVSALFADTRLSQNLDAIIKAYTEQPYRPLRRGEFYSSGFLTEEQELPYGTFLGPIVPSQISSTRSRGAITIFTEVAVTPPEGAQYQVGDTLLIVRRDRDIDNYGEVIVPTGMLRITDISYPQNRAVILSSFAAMRTGQQVLPAEPFRDPGEVSPVAVTDGIRAAVIASRDPQELKGPQNVIFLDMGRSQGVAPGDLFQFVSEPGSRSNGEVLVPAPMGLAQVVRVGERTATARVLTVSQPTITPGTPAQQVARLP